MGSATIILLIYQQLTNFSKLLLTTRKVELLIEKKSDDYFKFVSKYISVTAVNIATTAHAQIGREIQKLSTGENAILEQMDCCKSVSFNLHKEISECTLWKRIK